MNPQYIVICLCDSDDSHGLHHIQATRRRFESLQKAQAYAKGIPDSRDPIVVTVRAVPVDENNYPRTENDVIRAELARLIEAWKSF